MILDFSEINQLKLIFHKGKLSPKESGLSMENNDLEPTLTLAPYCSHGVYEEIYLEILQQPILTFHQGTVL